MDQADGQTRSESALRTWGPLAMVAVLLIAGFPYFGRFMNANERPRLLQAMAWVDTGTPYVDGSAARGIDPGIDVATSASGRLVPNKPPGATVPAALAWTAVRPEPGRSIDLPRYTWLARVLGAWLPTVTLLGFAFARLRRSFASPSAAAAVVLLAMGTPIASYAHVLYGHTLAACLLFIGLRWVVDAAEGNAGRGRFKAWAGGAAAAAAVTVEYAAVFAALPLAVWLGLRVVSAKGGPNESRRSATMASGLAAFAGALLPMALLAAYHDAVFGSPWSTPYHHVVRPEFAQIHDRGLLGLTWPTLDTVFEHALSPWGGLLYWAPLTVAAVVASLRAWKRGEASSFERLGAAVFLVQLAVLLGLSQTGGWRVGPRYLVAAMPFVLPGLCRLLESAAHRRAIMTLVVALAAWSVPINLMAGHLFPHLIPAGHPLVDQLLPLLGRGYEPYGLAELGVPGTELVLIVGALLTAFVLHGLPGDAARRAAPWLGGLGLAVAALFIGVAWIPSAPEAEANLDAIEGMWEPTPVTKETARLPVLQ